MLERWKSASLRSRLVAIMMILLTAAIIGTSFLTLSQLRGFLVTQLDAKLVSASNLSWTPENFDILTRTNPGLPSDYKLIVYTLNDAPFEHPASNGYNDGTGSRPNIPSMTWEQANEIRKAQTVLEARDTVGARTWRYTAIPVQVPGTVGTDPGAMIIALPLDSVDDAVQHTLALSTGIGILTLAVVFFVASWTVTHAFRPLRRVEKTAAAIAAGDLSQRVEDGHPGTEIGRLSASLNTMLAHIEQAFRARTASETRMRRFVSDASHELRTPLVTIRGFSELYRHGALSTPEDVSTAMGRIESEAKRMGAMVEDLLTLARMDEQRPLQLRPLDLLLIANDAVVDAQAASRDRVIRLVGLRPDSPAGPAPALGDESRLRQVVGNLVTNALRYTPAGTPLEIAVGSADAEGGRVAVLEVRDHGPGISSTDAPKIFERFFRADTSRTRETGGTGLGLAIVAAIVTSHKGAVRLTETPGGGASFVVELPYVQPSAEPLDSTEA